MTNKDRKIQLFLQVFFLLVGIYLLSEMVRGLYTERYPNNLFDFFNQNIPAIMWGAAVIGGLISLLSSLVLWLNLAWAYPFTLFASGYLLSYSLMTLGNAIYRNPYETIPVVILIITLLQSFPFILRQCRDRM